MAEAHNAGQAFATVLVDELVRHGMTDAVVAPGSRSTPVALALLADHRVRVHVRIDERSAAYLALGIARFSRRVVPVLCTSGTATSYLHGAVMEADLSRVPLLALTADRPAGLRGTGANQTIDQVALFGSAVRLAVDAPLPASEPGVVGHWRTLVTAAAQHCLGTGARRGEPPGPVQLNLPFDEPLLPVDDDAGFPFSLGLEKPNPAVEPDPPRDDVPPELARALHGVTRGVVVCGDTPSAMAEAATELAGRASWPLLAEPHSNARRGASALRATDAVLRDPGFAAAHRPDLAIVVGRVGLSRALLGWLAETPHVVVDPYGSGWDVTRTARAVIRCSAGSLAAASVTPAEPAWFAGWEAAATAAGDAIDAMLDATPELSEPLVAREVAATVPDDTALVVSSSMPIRDLDTVMRPRALRLVANRGVSGIDGFVSTAQGVAVAHDGPTVALAGDLSLLHDVNGLLPGPDDRPDVTYVVINNDGGGIFSLLPQAAGVAHDDFERVFGTPHGMRLADLAAAYRISHAEVRDVEALRSHLVSPAGLRIVEIRTDRTSNQQLHDRMRAAATSAVAGLRLGSNGQRPQ
ncbi:MAG TPA: 2-succinyl-5-enolpyruvyl-6-hydroxy-3-cyclohexene-1-carboxylic-acid synthase [Mycobacteriales bacterium]|jgi:2-succinyl-5-enolpyruvyl-6-hydroxy-3-cyclohexene-1-carboxylate synthase|nr:2-succinyl-5-enolpyruvyl-6-hydroxy-3-cyclohexene-1-carboxylic-acid synthase [Mycobacteriales bacterium]